MGVRRRVGGEGVRGGSRERWGWGESKTVLLRRREEDVVVI